MQPRIVFLVELAGHDNLMEPLSKTLFRFGCDPTSCASKECGSSLEHARLSGKKQVDARFVHMRPLMRGLLDRGMIASDCAKLPLKSR